MGGDDADAERKGVGGNHLAGMGEVGEGYGKNTFITLHAVLAPAGPNNHQEVANSSPPGVIFYHIV